jgi:hypothetical protein
MSGSSAIACSRSGRSRATLAAGWTPTNDVREAGCDDALIGRSDGVQYPDFERDAATIEDAVFPAAADAERVDGVEVLRIADAGIASMADIATRTGRSRESVRPSISGERGMNTSWQRSTPARSCAITRLV